MFAPLTNYVKNGSSIFLLDQNNDIVFSRNTSEAPSKEFILQHLNNDSGHFIQDDVLYTYQSINAINMTIVCVSSLKELLQNSKDTFSNMILVIIVGSVFSIIIMYFMVRIIISRLKNVIHILSLVTDGRFDIDVPVTGRDEAGELALEINILIKKINEQIKELIRKEREQKNAQIMALQYQINPHFLYNTLDFFKSRMELAGDYEGAETISSFAGMFRYNTDTDSIFTTIRNEISHVESYFNIQKIKYGDNICLSVNIPDDILQLDIIKFVFQPIVENCIIHGYNVKNQKIRICIDGIMKDNFVEITITDNGLGIDEDKLNRINQRFKNDDVGDNYDEHNTKLGLANINRRMKLFYGNDYFLKIDSKKDKYTLVIITIPYIKD